MRTTRSSAIFAFIAASVLFLQYQTSARSDTESAIMLSNKLNELKMFDYSEFALTQELAKNPADADLLKIQMAVTYFVSNKPDKANEIINSIPKTSEYYPNSRRVFGIEALKKGKNDMAVTALEEYFKIYLAKPPTTEVGKTEFREAAGYLVYAYKQMSKPSDAEKVLKYLDAIDKDDGNEDEGDKFLRQLGVRLDGIEEMIDSNKEGWKDLANKTPSGLFDKLAWRDQDPIRALALVEKARCYLYLGRLDDAFNLLTNKNNNALLNAFDEGYEKEGILHLSPSTYQNHWLGRIYIAKAEKAAEADKTALYIQAIQRLYDVLKIKTSEKYPKNEDVINCFLTCKEELEKRGKKVPIEAVKNKLVSRGPRSRGTPSMERREADQFFGDGKFQSALPLYAKAITNNRKSFDADYLLARLAYCYMKNDQLLEAMTIAGYLGDYFPTAENTPLTAVQIGEVLWSKKMYEDAIIVYSTYLKNTPSDQYAGDISARVAKYWFDKAAELAKAANALPQGEEKIKKAKEAKEAYVATVPYYKNIINNFQHTKYGISSYYLMGYCYTYADDYLNGAEAFTNFCEKELKKDGEKDIGSLADGKLRIADDYVQYASGLDKEADTLRNKATEAEAAAPATPAPAKDKKEAGKEAKDAKDDKAKPEAAKPAEKESPKDDKEVLTPVQMNARADELNKKAAGYYKEALKNLLELTGTWCAAGGILENTKDAKALKAIEVGYSLLGWTYDGLADKENACKAFDFFIKKYPQSKSIPASMFRLGKIYGEMNKYDIAGQVLENLADKFPATNEGKQALPSLGRNMYEVKNYEKSIQVFNKIFAQNVELTIGDLRWILANLSDCGGTHPKEGSELAVKAGDLLLVKLEKPDLKEWLGPQRMREVAGNPKELQRLISLIREKLYYDYANAAYWGNLYDKGIAKIDIILLNERSSYYYDGRFLRAMLYRGLKKFEKATNDYSDISMMAIGAKKYSIYNKVQCKIGDTYLEEVKEFPTKDRELLNKAYGSYNIVAITNMDEDPTVTGTKVSKEELKEQNEWIEYAVYMAAHCASRLGLDSDKAKMVEKYKKYFPMGKYLKEIDKLPAKEALKAPLTPADGDKEKKK